ncbi:MAG: hypothetical protein HZA52_11960 [Planctomycetes bacterium]|nr:hypothetical protein [Planctomycetota bacterium]
MVTARAWVWSAVLCTAIVAPSAAGVVIVDGSGTVYSDLPAAVGAAPDGATLLVGPGSYSGFTIADKSLAIFALPGATVVVDGSIRVSSLAASRRVVLDGLVAHANPAGPNFEPGLRVLDCVGDVRAQGCDFVGVLTDGCDGLGGAGAQVTNSSRVAFVDCKLTGGFALNLCACIGGGNGGYGLWAEQSTVALYDCTLVAAHGSSGQWYGGSGGSGAVCVDSELFASGSSFTPGVGAMPCSAGGNPGFDGVGVALADTESSARLLDCGAPSTSGQGTFVAHAGSARRFSAISVGVESAITSLTVVGEPGDRVFVASSFAPGFLAFPSLAGTWLVPFPALVAKQELGVVPPSGTLTASLRMPDVLGVASRVVYRQGLVLTSTGARLGSPLHQLALDRESGPDCDVNGSCDLVDQLEGAPDCNVNFVLDTCDVGFGTSPDCNANSVPDECDIGTGTSTDCDSNGVPDECQTLVDCNANGVLDACDIQSGTSSDANHNGVPDECEPTGVTWWVDASAPPGGNGSAAQPFQTIGEAIAGALSGHTIVVKDGVYTGAGNRELDFTGRNLIVQSEHGAASCIIDCQGLGRAFYLHTNEAAPARIQGFTIRNGVANGVSGLERGGAILAWYASPEIVGCVFESCTAARFGGALFVAPKNVSTHVWIRDCAFVDDATPPGSTLYPGYGGGLAIGDPFTTAVGTVHVVRCTFDGCSSSHGGAIASVRGTTITSHCAFRANSARIGGAMYLGGSWSSSRIEDCLFAGNHATTSLGRGGALASDVDNGFPCPVEVRSSTFAANTSEGAGGAMWFENHSNNVLADSVLWGDSSLLGQGNELALFADYLLPTVLTVSYCDVAGNQAGVWRNSTTFTTLNWNAGNLAVDPRFVDADGPDDDPLTFGDNVYRLQSSSPCLDAGDNAGVGPDANDIDGDGNLLESTPFDLNSKPRFTDLPLVPDTGLGTPPLVDLGCYERQG